MFRFAPHDRATFGMRVRCSAGQQSAYSELANSNAHPCNFCAGRCSNHIKFAANRMSPRCSNSAHRSEWSGRGGDSEHGAYTGAFMDFGDAEDDVTLETIEEFEQMIGKHQAIIASSSYWGEQNFPVDNLNVIWRHGSLPLVFWSPWDRPYEEDHGPDKFSLT